MAAKFDFLLLHKKCDTNHILNSVKSTLEENNLPYKWTIKEAEYDEHAGLTELLSFQAALSYADGIIVYLNLPPTVHNYQQVRGQMAMAIGAGKKVFVWRYCLTALENEPLLQLCHCGKTESEFIQKLIAHMPGTVYRRAPELEIVAAETKLREILPQRQITYPNFYNYNNDPISTFYNHPSSQLPLGPHTQHNPASPYTQHNPTSPYTQHNPASPYTQHNPTSPHMQYNSSGTVYGIPEDFDAIASQRHQENQNYAPKEEESKGEAKIPKSWYNKWFRKRSAS